MTRLDAGFRARDVDGSRLTGIPTQPTPQVVVPGPARRNAKNAHTSPMSIRYMAVTGLFRRKPYDVQGLGNRQRNVLPADVWIVGNQYNKTAKYRPPTAVANPTWRINNVTTKDIQNIKTLQQQKRQSPGR